MRHPSLQGTIRFFSLGEFTVAMRAANPVGEHFLEARHEVVRVGKVLHHEFFDDAGDIIGVWTRNFQLTRKRTS